MDRGVAVFCHHTLTDQDRIFKVVAVPWHKSNQHVLADGDFTQVSRCAVGNHVTLVQLVAHLDDRTLVDVGVLVGALVLDEVVDVHAHFTGQCFCIVHAHHNAGSVDIIHDAAARGGHYRARVDGGNALDTGTDQWFFRAQHRHGLTRHIGTHQRAIGIVMLQKRNKRRGDRHDLSR